MTYNVFSGTLNPTHSLKCITQATISQTNFTLPQDWSLLRQCSSVNGYAVTEISVYCKDVFRGSFSFLS